jgi:hypothetical protein
MFEIVIQKKIEWNIFAGKQERGPVLPCLSTIILDNNPLREAITCILYMAKAELSIAGLIRDQRYRSGPDTIVPMPDLRSWLLARNANVGRTFSLFQKTTK